MSILRVRSHFRLHSGSIHYGAGKQQALDRIHLKRNIESSETTRPSHPATPNTLHKTASPPTCRLGHRPSIIPSGRGQSAGRPKSTMKIYLPDVRQDGGMSPLTNINDHLLRNTE